LLHEFWLDVKPPDLRSSRQAALVLPGILAGWLDTRFRITQSEKAPKTSATDLRAGEKQHAARLRCRCVNSSSQIWAELHEKAFRRLGGVTQVVVLDNLKEGVLTPDIYDPTLNPLYRDVLTHYGSVALACRVRDPDRKGKVESGVGHAQRTPLKGQRFESLEEAQAYLDHWEERWADTRIHGTTKRQVAAMFAEEKPALLPLPIEPFRYYQYGKRKVNLDGCVEVDAAYYSAPPGWIGQEVPVQWDHRYIRVLHPQTGELLREHLPQVRGKHRIQDEDRPKQTPPGTQHLLLRAGRAGQQIGVACRKMCEEEGQVVVRRINNHGIEPKCGVVRDSAGNLYGAALDVVYKLTLAGQYEELAVFPSALWGEASMGDVALDGAGNLYGTTNALANAQGAAHPYGVLYKVDVAGKLTVVYSLLSDFVKKIQTDCAYSRLMGGCAWWRGLSEFRDSKSKPMRLGRCGRL
jgi:hypothetical protein